MTDTFAALPVAAAAKPPDYIRVYAAMNGSEASRLALEYTKALLRIAPVRAIPCDGAGIWPGYERLLITPTVGAYVNVVACGPDSWTRTHRYEVPPKADPVLGVPAKSSWVVDAEAAKPSAVSQIPPPKPEIVIERFDYWTAGVRNVLFAAAPPRDQFQLATAKKFDLIVVPTHQSAYFWTKSHRLPQGQVKMIGTPIIAEAGYEAIRTAVLG